MYTPRDVVSYEQAGRIARRLRKTGRKIVFVSGSYDLPHLGHASFFEQARAKGDALFVSVGSDQNIRSLKGPSRPILSGAIRVRTVASFAPVDYAVLDREGMTMPGKLNFVKLIAKIKPHIFVVNANDSAIAEKRALCKKLGIRLVLVRPRNVISTTQIIKKVLLESKPPKLSKPHKRR